ncbi:MAG TPA: hypothetical protein VEH09_11680 [Thermodesulfobacteriota bacterium]|nr:hypothetical protein [Thermodesulfobacteriota bacterium]
MKGNKIRDFLSQLWFFGGKKKKPSKNLQPLLELAGREPTNGYPHLKIAEVYRELGQTQDALQENLKAAEIFCDFEQYHKGVSVYTKILKENPGLDFVKAKLADTYRKMGFLEESFDQYCELLSFYKSGGQEDKSLEILGILAELDPQKFDLQASDSPAPGSSAKIVPGPGPKDKDAEIHLNRPEERETSSFFDLAQTLEADGPVELEEPKSIKLEETCKSEKFIEELEKAGNAEKLYPHYHYQMGLVCKEMGLIDEAIKQFRRALEKGQKAIEASKLLDRCLQEKGLLENSKSSERTPQEGGTAGGRPARREMPAPFGLA